MTNQEFINTHCDINSNYCSMSLDSLNSFISSQQASSTPLNYAESGEYFGVGVGLFIALFVVIKPIGLVLKLIREG